MLITDSLDFAGTHILQEKKEKNQNPTNKFSRRINPTTNALHIVHAFPDYKTRG